MRAPDHAGSGNGRGILQYLNVIGFCFAILLLLVIGASVYRTAVHDLEAGSQQRIRALTADNPSQQERLNVLEPLITQRISFARRTVDSRDQGDLAEAAKVDATGDSYYGITQTTGG